MIDAATKKNLRVSNEGTVGPYIRVAVDQLAELRTLLDNHGIRYWVHENQISWDGGPFMTVVDFGRAGDAATIQALLDSSR